MTARSPLEDDQREELLDEIQRRGATVGHSIPESVEIDGTELDLKAFVWETKQQGVVPPDQRERVRSVRASLTRKRDRLLERLKTDDLTVEEGESITETIVGIDRAITALQNLKEPDLAEADREHTIEDNRRWVNFLEAILEE